MIASSIYVKHYPLVKTRLHKSAIDLPKLCHKLGTEAYSVLPVQSYTV